MRFFLSIGFSFRFFVHSKKWTSLGYFRICGVQGPLRECLRAGRFRANLLLRTNRILNGFEVFFQKIIWQNSSFGTPEGTHLGNTQREGVSQTPLHNHVTNQRILGRLSKIVLAVPSFNTHHFTRALLTFPTSRQRELVYWSCIGAASWSAPLDSVLKGSAFFPWHHTSEMMYLSVSFSVHPVTC